MVNQKVKEIYKAVRSVSNKADELKKRLKRKPAKKLDEIIDEEENDT